MDAMYHCLQIRHNHYYLSTKHLRGGNVTFCEPVDAHD